MALLWKKIFLKFGDTEITQKSQKLSDNLLALFTCSIWTIQQAHCYLSLCCKD